MADNESPLLPPPSAEDLRIAAGHFEYAHRVTTAGSYDIAIAMLRNCCRLVPANLNYRQTLRKVEKTRYRGNLRGSLLAPLTGWPARLRLWRAYRRGDHRKVLEYGEAVLAKNPWDRDANLLMAEAAAALGLPVLAVWILQESRERNPNDLRLNRALARLLEKEGKFPQAMHLWELVRKALPNDREATEKAKQLAVTDTISRGNYEEAVSGEGASSVVARAGRGGDSNKGGAGSRPIQEVEVLRTRIAAEPAAPEAYLQLAAVYRRQGKLTEARTLLEEAVGATGGAPAVVTAQSELEIDLLRRALTQADETLRATPEDEKLQKTRRKVEHRLRGLEMAALRRRIETDPGDRAAHFELGMRLEQAGQVEEAIGEFQAARLDPKLHWKAVLQLGHCFLARGKWPLAQRNFEEALRNLPDAEKEHRKEVLFLLAQGYAEAGELPRAIQLALDLADLDYTYRDVGRLLDDYQRRAQEPRGPTWSR